MQRYFFLHLAALFYTFTDNCKQQLTCLIVNESLSIETCRVYFAAIYEIRDSDRHCVECLFAFYCASFPRGVPRILKWRGLRWRIQEFSKMELSK